MRGSLLGLPHCIKILENAMIPQTIDQYQCGEFDLVRNRFHVAMGLYRGRSQLTSKCGKKKVIHEMPDVSGDPFLYKPQATWNLFCSI